MSVETRTVQPRPNGSVKGKWRERYGDQRVNIHVAPGVRADSEFRVSMERRWGPGFTDVLNQDFVLSREGAKVLRDALTAALEWKSE